VKTPLAKNLNRLRKKSIARRILVLRKKREDYANDNDNDDEFWIDDGWLKLMSQSKKQRTK